MRHNVKKQRLQRLLEAVASEWHEDADIYKIVQRYLGTDDTLLSGLIELAEFSLRPSRLREGVAALGQGGALSERVLEVARWHGDTEGVLAIDRWARANNSSTLEVNDFGEWFESHGVAWFELYIDPEQGCAFISPEQASLFRQIVSERFVDLDAFWNQVLSRLEADPLYSRTRLQLLRMLAAGEEYLVVALEEDPREHVDEQFRAWCDESGVVILHQLQVGQTGIDLKSNVYLALDTDHIIKVFKELVPPQETRLKIHMDPEDELHAIANGIQGFPVLYSTVEVAEDVCFLRMEVCYGQGLLDFLREGRKMQVDEACHTAHELARILTELHARGILYLDLRPENVKINGKVVQLFDLSASRRAGPGETINCHLHDPRYTPPEMTLEQQVSSATDVFQLGVLFYQLATGRHPFEISEHPGGPDYELGTLFFALPAALYEYEHDLDDPRLAIIERMLAYDPAERPSMAEVHAWLSEHSESVSVNHQPRPEPIRTRECNTVLFPARMGLPHRGHIDFISRLLELGFHVQISLNWSYRITDRDPYPKWLVMKMVAQSLLRRGFRPGDFSFLLTPFYETDQEHAMHFVMMPGREDLVAIASSNPVVKELLFRHMPFITQRTLFANEGEEYETRSWGEILRTAVREGDRETFDQYVACGVEDILTFEELQACYADTPIEFLRGIVRAELPDLGVVARVRRYDTPESALEQAMQGRMRIIDPFARDSVVEIDGERQLLHYESRRIEDGKHEYISYRLKPIGNEAGS